jgi:hypothetical protein
MDGKFEELKPPIFRDTYPGELVLIDSPGKKGLVVRPRDRDNDWCWEDILETKIIERPFGFDGFFGVEDKETIVIAEVEEKCILRDDSYPLPESYEHKPLPPGYRK